MKMRWADQKNISLSRPRYSDFSLDS